MIKINDRVKTFMDTYIPMAKAMKAQREKVDGLTKEIEEIYEADREREAARLEGIRKASGVNLPPDPNVKDSRYAVKLRQKEEAQEEYTKQAKSFLEQKNKIRDELKDREAELKDFETKYLANAKRALKIEEQKMELGGSAAQMALFEQDAKDAKDAIDVLRKKSDEVLEEVELLQFFLQTLEDFENDRYDFKKLEKLEKEIKKITNLSQAKETLEEAIIKSAKSGPGAGTPPPAGPGAGTPPPAGPGAGTPPPAEKPEGAIKTIRYSAVDNAYELTFENGAKLSLDVKAKALRGFNKKDKRYLKERIPGFGAYKRCDIGLFKALREIDREEGTHHFDEYIKLLNGEESTIENITYDAEKMNDPAAFSQQETEAREVMTRMMRKVRNIDGIDVIGYKPTRFQRFVDFFTGGNKPKQIEQPKEPRVEVHDDEIAPPEVINHRVVEVHDDEIAPPRVVNHELTTDEARRVREAFGSRRTQRGQDWAASLHVEGETAPEAREYTVDEIIDEVKSWGEEHPEEEK